MNYEAASARLKRMEMKLAARDVSIAIPITMTTTRSFLRQWEAVNDNARAIALLCSRRSGKTVGSIIRTIKRNCETAGRKVLYIHHTLSLARDQFFRPLLDRLREHGVKFEANLAELTIKWANGSLLKCIGCNDMGDTGKSLGFDWHEILIDEAQEFADEVLRELVDRTLLPTMIDHGGTLIMQGTPPDVHAGLWFEVLTGTTWSQRRWTLLENPHIKRDLIVETMGLRGFSIDFDNPESNDPIIQREIFGLLAVDKSKLAYLYDPKINNLTDVDTLSGPADRWRFSLGLDLGLSDCDAIAVAGWRTDDPNHEISCRYQWKENHLDVDALAEKLKQVVDIFHPCSYVGDTGGHGAVKVLETLAGRFGITFERKPASVRDSVALLNDDYRAGRAKVPAGTPLAEESQKVTWAANRREFSTAFHSDITEAWRYAHHAALLAGYYRELHYDDAKKTLRGEREARELERERERKIQSGRHYDRGDEWITE